jgi:hypothetical protein
MKRLITLIAVFGSVAAICVPVATARTSLYSGLDPWTQHLIARNSASSVVPDDRVGAHGITSDRSASSFYTPAALKADGLRWQGLVETSPASSFYTPAALKADGLRWQAMADASPASSFYTPAALKADGLRWQAVADASRSASSFYTPAALDAWGLRMQAQAQYELVRTGNISPDDRPGIRGPGPQPIAGTSDDGVNVRVIGIGLGSGFFALLLVGGLVAMMRRSKRQELAHA